MHRSTRLIVAVLAAATLSACGGEEAEVADSGSGDAEAASYGECEVSGEQGSFELEPTTADV
jgi:hypothetical protein